MSKSTARLRKVHEIEHKDVTAVNSPKMSNVDCAIKTANKINATSLLATILCSGFATTAGSTKPEILRNLPIE